MSGIIDTPKNGRSILLVEKVDRYNRVNIRVPCETREKGYEAIEMQDIFAQLDRLENRKFEELMPVGYLYTQYAGTPDPTTLYPKATWANISASYAGNFFRVEGGLASDFESGRQEESVPNITGYIPYVVGGQTGSGGAFSYETATNLGYAQVTSNTNAHIAFNASRSNPAYGRRNEVAPQNQTIRIWRKVGNVSGRATFARVDASNIFIENVELSQDEAGYIG